MASNFLFGNPKLLFTYTPNRKSLEVSKASSACHCKFDKCWTNLLFQFLNIIEERWHCIALHYSLLVHFFSIVIAKVFWNSLRSNDNLDIKKQMKTEKCYCWKDILRHTRGVLGRVEAGRVLITSMSVFINSNSFIPEYAFANSKGVELNLQCNHLCRKKLNDRNCWALLKKC